MTTADQDADEVHRILNQINRKDEELIALVSNRPRAKRFKIREAYKTKYKTEIIEDIVNKLSEHYTDTLAPGVELLFEEPALSDVKQLYISLKKAIPNPDPHKVIEIICSRPYTQLKRIKELYFSMYDKKLDDEISSTLDEELQKVLCKFLIVKRSTSMVPDKAACRTKAKEIMDLKPGTWGDGDSALVDTLSTCSSRELILVCRYFHANTGKTLPNAMDEEFSGDLGKYMKEILYVLCCPAEFMATKINNSLLHEKVEYCTAFNIITSREEYDLKLVKRYYAQLFGKELEAHINELYKRDDKLFLLEYLKNY